MVNTICLWLFWLKTLIFCFVLFWIRHTNIDSLFVRLFHLYMENEMKWKKRKKNTLKFKKEKHNKNHHHHQALIPRKKRFRLYGIWVIGSVELVSYGTAVMCTHLFDLNSVNLVSICVWERVCVCVCVCARVCVRAYRCRFAMVLKAILLAMFHKKATTTTTTTMAMTTECVVRVCGCNSLAMAKPFEVVVVNLYDMCVCVWFRRI